MRQLVTDLLNSVPSIIGLFEKLLAVLWKPTCTSSVSANAFENSVHYTEEVVCEMPFLAANFNLQVNSGDEFFVSVPNQWLT